MKSRGNRKITGESETVERSNRNSRRPRMTNQYRQPGL